MSHVVSTVWSERGETMINVGDTVYATRIIKAGALLADTKTFLTQWDPDLNIPSNLQRFRQENVFGKASRSRVEDILTIFRQRYLAIPSVTRALVTLAKGRLPAESLDRILYYFAAQADDLLHDVVTEVVWERYAEGKSEITVDALQTALNNWVTEGKTVAAWGTATTLRVAQGLMSTLRDFGVLHGKVKKQIAPVFLPIQAFAFIAFYLKEYQPAQKLVDHPEWRLFFLSAHTVEQNFMEAHQHKLLEYYAAGTITRVTFPSETIEEYARVIVSTAP